MKKLILLALLIGSPFVMADWTLNTKESSLSFLSTKNASVTEIHTFQAISGEVVGGKAKLSIDLASVETQIPIRNDRMKEHLFEITRYPQAIVELNLEPNVFDLLQIPGSMVDMPVKANLEMHGVKKEVTTKLRVVRLIDNRLVASTSEPILLIPGDFGMQPGLKKLMEIANLNNIASTVPVTFSLMFEQK